MNNEKILFCLLRVGLELEREDPHRVSALFEVKPDWKWIYKMAAKQGVLAIVFDGLNKLINDGLIPVDMLPDKSMKLQWGFNVVKIEQRFEQQKTLAIELADQYAAHNIRTVVLKGLAVAQYYPVPNHRPCGDMDCFLCGNYESGNQIAEQIGADVKRDYYKHAHVSYKGLTVENHQFCTAIRGSKKAKRFEKELQKLLEEPQNKILDSNLEQPNPLFNALFLTIHAWGHFLTEGIALRHLIDWALLVQRFGREIDWVQFKGIAESRDRGMYRFAESMVCLAHYILGVDVPSRFKVDNALSATNRAFLHSILFDDDKINNKGYSAWKGRVMLVLNAFKSDWKYKAFSEQTSVSKTLNNIGSFIFERNPHL